MHNVSHTIAIVGAGFSGTVTAIHLLRQAPERPTRILLIERGPEFGRGLAYAKNDFPALLNVPASRMSATLSDPDEFLRFAQQRFPRTTGEDFLPRSLYGDYLQHLLAKATEEARPTAALEFVRGEVVSLAEHREQGFTTLSLSDGRSLLANVVVMAMGVPAQRPFNRVESLAGSTDISSTAAAAGVPQSKRKRLLIVGTGLSMVDELFAALEADPGLKVHAISRHGLIPQGQTSFEPDALLDDSGQLAMSAGSTSRLVAVARRLARESERAGGDWREVVTLVRRQAPALWRSLPDFERTRFLRHVRCHWDTHRHRVPASQLSRLEELQANGTLSVYAGRLLSLTSGPRAVRATWMPRGSNQRQILDVDRAVDCSGLEYNVTLSSEPLWQALLAEGLVTPDPLKIGIRTGPYGALVGNRRGASRKLYYVGPLLRADYWEATAVGELRLHAEQLARHLVEANRPVSSPAVT
jgi:uncharacterized NAD(P)/FAD-binding protein YdhS